jgi:hypothetical protein
VFEETLIRADTVSQMIRGSGPCPRAGRLACLFALPALLVAAPVAGAKPGPAGKLSPRLAELAKPSLRSAPDAVQARKLSLVAEGPGSLLRQGNRVLVYVRFDRGAAAAADALRSAGGQVIDVSRRYQTVTVAAKPADLPKLDDPAGVRSVTEVLSPIVRSPGDPVAATTPYKGCFGIETSEGDVQLRVAEARAKFEVAGSGTKVGILSDSFDRDPTTPTGAAEDVASGDLPGPGNPCGYTTPVQVLDDSESEGADEGRAMAQIVHDLAPGAALAFATAFNGEPGFAANIEALAATGAQEIVDDVSYLEEPFFQEGPVGVAVSKVTAGSSDVAYFSAAGNDNTVDGEGNDIGSWEAKFRDSGSCPAAVVALGPGFNPNHCADFDPTASTDNTFEITVSPGAELVVDLQWAEPWEGVTSDFDAFLLSSANKLVAGSAVENILPESQRPLEVFGWENESTSAAKVQLVINRFTGTTPRLKFILVQNGSGVTAIEYKKSSGEDVVGPTIFGHNGGKDAMTIGAIRYTTKSAPEMFSSRGPVTHYFEPVKPEGTGPAAPLLSPEVLAKPDVVATDGGANTFFGTCTSGAWRFLGTSAAAPHAAAVAALEREGKPSADATAVKKAEAEGAVAVGSFPPTAVGSGLVSAVGALEKLGVTPPAPGAVPASPPPPGPCLPPRAPLVPAPTGSPTPSVSKDTTRPRTFIRKHPPRVIRTRHRKARAVFVFGSNEAEVTFACRIDGGRFRLCPRRLVRRFSIGRHNLQVVARDPSGNGDRTPAVFRFRVEHVG